MTATAMPPSAGPRMAPVWLTLAWYETPWTACSMGMTCASKADRAGRSKPLAMPVTKMTARIGGEAQRRVARQQRERHRADRRTALVTG